MKDAKSLLDGLVRGLGGGASGGLGGVPGGLGQMAEQAKGLWDQQGGMTKMAAGGGLVALLLGGRGTKKIAGTALKVGGAAVVGALAMRAWQDWQAGKQAEIAKAPTPAALPSPEGTVFLPSDAAAADDLSTRLVQAMVAAAKADGHITDDERARITEQLGNIGLDAEGEKMIADELNTPLDVGHIAGLARTPEEGAEIYAASLLVVDPDAPAEKGYLAMLAARLKLDPELVKHLHARVAELA
ncbi:tellurite resistance TerB family protein [Falsirhodobacter halotolerans]|uniref:tellurite resistance TerB family protein n=1 Tax=Falsirhodobacter halotolerans TaxID=1146892 RepID=UPI001FD0DC24|nr:tellurite resistance TerB family protein [Falsirhodobacter halotolerans]MCJ8138689.1 tellurite resistance TerB family protein [Falsirhodobacter halotolerans]